MQNEDAALYFVMPVDDTAWWLNDLSVAPTTELLRLRTAVRMGFELINMLENPPDELLSSGQIFECDVVRNSI